MSVSDGPPRAAPSSPAGPSGSDASPAGADTPVYLDHVTTRIGEQEIHRDLTLEVARGEILGLVGGSGSGKSVLLRSMIGLLRPEAGSVRVFGTDIYEAAAAEVEAVKRRWGVLFQNNALFSTLTVAENIAVPLREHGRLPEYLVKEIVGVKAMMSGLPLDALEKYPSELSGGLQKRAGVARAIALDPELLLLDEPTSGLDPVMASQIDRLIRDLAQSLGITVVLVTHDIDTLYAICDRVAALAEKHIVAIGPVTELENIEHPWLREYLLGKRSRAGIEVGCI